MSLLEELNDAGEITFLCQGKVVAERTWNYVPDVNDIVELDGNNYRAESRIYHDRKEGFFAGLGRQRISIHVIPWSL